MKKYIILTALVAGLFACTPNNEKIQADNVALIKNYVAAVENLDFEAMNNYLADEYMGLGPSYGDTIYKAQAILKKKCATTSAGCATFRARSNGRKIWFFLL